MVLQIVVSVIASATKLRDITGDPWDGRTLEWLTASPPPFYNFAHTPVVHTLDALAEMKLARHRAPAPERYQTSTCRATPARASIMAAPQRACWASR